MTSTSHIQMLRTMLRDEGRDLCSQPTVSRWENAPSLRDLIRLMGVMVDLYCVSYTTSPRRNRRSGRRRPQSTHLSLVARVTNRMG